MLLPRLRTTKISGSDCSRLEASAPEYRTRANRRGAQAAVRVATRITFLYLVGRDAEVLGNIVNDAAGLETINEIRDSRPAVSDQGEAEGHYWINDNLGVPVGRQPDRIGPAIATA